MDAKELAELAPYIEALGPLQGCHFAGAMAADGWKELARTLRECSKNEAHAVRIVNAFVRTPRYDKDGELLTAVPAAIELRVFAKTVPEQEMPNGELAAACRDCAPYDGLWRIVERKGCEATERCVCARGRALRAMDAVRKNAPAGGVEMHQCGGEWKQIAAGDIE